MAKYHISLMANGGEFMKGKTHVSTYSKDLFTQHLQPLQIHKKNAFRLYHPI